MLFRSVFSGDQHYPSAHILNWKTPLNFVSKTDTSAIFSLIDLGTAVFDFCASPLNYKRAIGLPLLSKNQQNPLFSYEIFRADWAKPGKTKQNNAIATSVFDVAEIDTKSSPANVVVKFYELNHRTSKMVELYRVKVTY